MAPAYRHCIGTLAALLALGALAGCGNGYTKRDFVARADAICTTTTSRLRSIPPPGFGRSQARQRAALAAYLAAAVPLVQSQSSQLHALPRPAQDARARAALARWLAAVAQAAEGYRELEAAAREGDAQGVASAEADLRASPAGSLAAAYGLSACAAPVATVT